MFDMKLNSDNTYTITITQSMTVHYPTEETMEEVQKACKSMARNLTIDLNEAINLMMITPPMNVRGD